GGSPARRAALHGARGPPPGHRRRREARPRGPGQLSRAVVVPGERRLVVRVPVEAAGMRLDRFLATLPELGTRSRAKGLIDDGRVAVDGVPRKSAHAVRAGERIAVTVPPPEPTGGEAEALPLVVLYEDAPLLAIDKPPGMVVHPAPGARRGTVVSAVLHRLGALETGGGPARPRLVHPPPPAPPPPLP